MNNNKIIVILDNIRSALNVGAIFRTCDASAVEELILFGITPTKEHKKVIKTALGAENYVKSTHFESYDRLLSYLDENKYSIVSVEQTEESEEYQEETKQILENDRIALVFGNEITGVSPQLLTKSYKIVNLPMLGKKKSLNVSTTVGIMLYHYRTYERN